MYTALVHLTLSLFDTTAVFSTSPGLSMTCMLCPKPGIHKKSCLQTSLQLCKANLSDFCIVVADHVLLISLTSQTIIHQWTLTNPIFTTQLLPDQLVPACGVSASL